MAEKLSRHGADLDLGVTQPLATPGAPGKSTLTSKLFRRPIINIYRAAERDDNGVAAGADEHIERAAGSSGSALPADLRERFESSLGADLSGVRIHTGADSETAASAVGARAYTVGNDIHFGAGQYDPSSSEGQFLIAHEVAHTVQQAGSAPTRQNKLEVSTTGDAAEVEADRAAAAMVGGGAFAIAGAAPAMVQRAGDTELTFKGGDHEGTAKIGADGKTENGFSRLLFDDSVPKQLCPAPPIYATLGVSIKASGTVGDSEKGAANATDAKGSIAIEIEGSLGVGAAEKNSRFGIEGGIKGSVKFESGITVTPTGGLPNVEVLPFERDVEVEAWMGLVADGGEIGGSIKRTLSSITLGKVGWNGHSGWFTYTATAADWEKAAKELWDEGTRLAAEVLVPGYGAYRQHQKDQQALEEFHANTAKMEAESESLPRETPEERAERDKALLESSRPAMKAQAANGDEGLSPEERKKLIEQRHPQMKAKVDAARAKASAAKARCNSLGGNGVKPAASKLYSQGFALFSAAEQSWAAAEAAAASGDNDTHYRFSHGAVQEFEKSAESFAAGDAAQG